ncbi:Phosphoribosyl 1,2-cyclic phosphate phosphodiesterase [Borrelia miyamotoi]|uniref:MBL fold metallo-hydrolase n=1 Tax=Borrelia miyamotoi TaxID=47466 RepID=UPI001C77AA2C|nr:MBL fold metallo-hydrolase [Borrelia miyamotoi]BCR19479.1 Phosphoribosyl 1,2-cyclic phosphate phosphodiesterase [Borrelia miyamotoi]BCR20312.1 Phosphoribosyl 1,2-cyclic phosphate phosphodiesterase [Borrelia miyamotoi]
MLGIFLGTGASSGIPMLNCSCKVCSSNYGKNKRLRSSFLLSLHGMNLLIDTGPDIRTQLLRENVVKLDLVLYTHEHYDHIMGLDDIKFYTRTSPLPIYARDSAMQHIKNAFPHNFSSKTSISGRVNVIPNLAVDLQQIVFRGINIIPIPLLHGDIISLGYRINNLAYLTDVKFIPEISYNYLKGLDVLVIDALRINPHPGHLHFDDAIIEVKKVSPKIAYFTHIAHDIMHEEFDYLKREDIYLAYDGLRIHV